MDIRDTDEYKSGDFRIVTCPICKNETLDMYWICACCGWEYDYTADENEKSIANGMTIREYRATYVANSAKQITVQAKSPHIELCREIISLLHSPELKEFLLRNPQNLKADDYANIVAGAPISLMQKRMLLTRLANNSETEKESATIKSYITALNSACEFLYGKSGKPGFLSITLRTGCNLEDDNRMDGAYYASSIKEAQKAIREYRKENDDDDWKCLYWKIEQLHESAPVGYCGFLLPKYTFIANDYGEIQYFLQNGTPLFSTAAEAFGGVNLNLPVPYRPGDILEIDCSPYTDGPRYCRLTKVGNDCCGIQCVYPDEDGKLRSGALKHGNYFASPYRLPQYLSPLYHAKKYTGKLPEKYRIINQKKTKAEEI